MLTTGTWLVPPDCDTNACVEVKVDFLPPAGVAWTKPQCDTSACVEVSDPYPTPGFQGGNVEVRHVEDGVEMRNSSQPGVVVSFTMEEWRTFLANADKFVAA
jgi:hypothetical protein